jgi:hypothetical protein
MDETSKPRGRPFQPGQSGNPSGRPKRDLDIKALALEHTQTAVDTLVRIMRDKKAPPSAQLQAAIALIDRAYGKPPACLAVKADPHEAFLRIWQHISDGVGEKLVEARAANSGFTPPDRTAEH